jgi:hypothetical protein
MPYTVAIYIILSENVQPSKPALRWSGRSGRGEGGVLAQNGAIEQIINCDKWAKKTNVKDIPSSTINPMAPQKSKLVRTHKSKVSLCPFKVSLHLIHQADKIPYR